MKITTLSKLSLFAFPLALGALVACGPDKDESPGEKTEDAVEETGDRLGRLVLVANADAAAEVQVAKRDAGLRESVSERDDPARRLHIGR